MARNTGRQSAVAEIAAIIRSEAIASDVYRSVDTALKSRVAKVDGGRTVKDVFERSLDSAIRDIESHPRGKLFRRLIQYGPPDPDDPRATTSDGETTLSDPECVSCVNFIHRLMFSRFKGELAELLALEPSLQLSKQLRDQGRLPGGLHLYWGDLVQERRRLRNPNADRTWGNFTKGADGLLVLQEPRGSGSKGRSLKIHGIVEVKSASQSSNKILRQIRRHELRLRGGVKLGPREWSADQVTLPPAESADNGLVRILVVPSTWKLEPPGRSIRIDDKTRMISRPVVSAPRAETRIEQFGPDSWKITLAWSHEALSEAALEMTFWYMAQVGTHVFANQPLPAGLASRTPESAAQNLIKYRLYVIAVRSISARQALWVHKLYNHYSFGYAPAAKAGGEMLWPEDLAVDDQDDAIGDKAAEPTEA